MSDNNNQKNKIINLFEFDINSLIDKTDANLSGKFVIISNNGYLNLIYGPIGSYSYHANLVSQFCNLFKISSGWENRPDLYVIYDSEYRIRGGGWFEFKFMEKKLKIFGYSTAYGSFTKQDFLDINSDNKDFSRFEIEIT